MERKKSNWGGVREGAGRKKKYARNYFFSATQEVADILEHLDGNRTDFINHCILVATRQSGTSLES